MLTKLANLGRRSTTKSKSRPSVSSRSRRNSTTTKTRPLSIHDDDHDGLLKPPSSSRRRARSHEAERRRHSAAGRPSSREDDEYYYRDSYPPPPPRRTDTARLRSVSPRPRRPPTLRDERSRRRRSRRDASISADEDSRTISPRGSPRSPRYPADNVVHQDWDRPAYHDTHASQHSPSRPVVRPYPPEAHRPVIDRRRMSYDASYATRPAAGAYRSSPPVGYRSSNHSQPEIPRKARSPSQDNVRRSRYPDAVSPGRPAERPAQKPRPKPQPKPSESGRKSSINSSDFLNKLPEALATFTGLKILTDHADTAKEWADWLNDLQGAPEEIQALSAKATTAKDTITQIQHSLEARPDLVEGENGQMLKQQIESTIKNTDASLEEMTKLLQELGNDGTEGTVMKGLQDFYNSYRYKNEWEGKIKEAEANLQRELGTLSTLMVNIYSRALMKPAPPGSTATVPPPSPLKPREKSPPRSQSDKEDKSTPNSAPSTRESKETPKDSPKAAPKDTHCSSINVPSLPRQTIPTNEPPCVTLDPPPIPTDRKSSKPPSPATVAKEEADIGIKTPPLNTQEPPTTTDQPKADMNANNSQPKRDPEPQGKDEASESSSHDSHEIALLDAAWNGDLDATSRELKHCSPMTRDLQGLTPMHLAVERDHLATAMLLRDHKVDCDARDNNGRTPLHLASKFASAAMVEFLLEKCRADPNARTRDGRTPLHYAAASAVDGDEERRDVLRVLRDWGADPLAVDRKNRAPRNIAQDRDCWDAAATLSRAEKAWEKTHRQNWLQRHGFKK